MTSSTGGPKVITALLSYKMADRTNRTVEQIRNAGFILGQDLFVFENQDKDSAEDVSEFVTHFTGRNLRMTGGFNAICDWIYHSGLNPEIVWLCTNDFDIVRGPPDLPGHIYQAFHGEKIVGWWHPSKTVVADYAYPWMNPVKEEGVRIVKMTDFICPALWWKHMLFLREKNGFWFDPSFYRGWGIDYDTCIQIRRDCMSVVVDDGVLIDHKSSETYLAGKAPETKDQFYTEAHKEMWQVLTRKYGPSWQREVTNG